MYYRLTVQKRPSGLCRPCTGTSEMHWLYVEKKNKTKTKPAVLAVIKGAVLLMHSLLMKREGNIWYALTFGPFPRNLKLETQNSPQLSVKYLP